MGVISVPFIFLIFFAMLAAYYYGLMRNSRPAERARQAAERRKAHQEQMLERREARYQKKERRQLERWAHQHAPPPHKRSA